MNDFLCDFVHSDEQMRAYELATQYHEECEAYDRLVCTSTKRGIAMPTDANELRLVNINAAKVRARILESAHMQGIDPDLVRRQISRIDN